MSNHTPGPWDLIWHGFETYPFPLSVVTEDQCSWIARDGTVSSQDNARLIAAAPDLLAALIALEGLFDDDHACVADLHECVRPVEMARAALVKVREGSSS